MTLNLTLMAEKMELARAFRELAITNLHVNKEDSAKLSAEKATQLLLSIIQEKEEEE